MHRSGFTVYKPAKTDARTEKQTVIIHWARQITNKQRQMVRKYRTIKHSKYKQIIVVSILADIQCGNRNSSTNESTTDFPSCIFLRSLATHPHRTSTSTVCRSACWESVPPLGFCLLNFGPVFLKLACLSPISFPFFFFPHQDMLGGVFSIRKATLPLGILPDIIL